MTIPPERSDSIFSSQPIKPGVSQGTPNTAFPTYSTAGASQTPSKAFPAQGPAAITPSSFASQTAGPSFNSLIAQVATSQDSLTNVRNLLNTKGLQFRRSQQHLLRNKLSDTSTYLRAANTRMGVETPPMPSQAGSRPIERFLSYVTDGENQLSAAQDKIMDMQQHGDQMRPADFLLVQVKLSQAQQEIGK